MARRKRTSTAEDLIDLISMLPWWAGVSLAIISYVVLHAWDARLAAVIAAQPTMNTGLLHMFVYAGQFALPFFCLVGAAASAWRRHQRKALADNVSAGKAADVLDGMSWREFELLVGEGFRLKGFSVVETGGGGADGGIDLVLRKGGEKHLVQCKQWRAYKVGVQVVRELYGAMAACGAAGGFVVTSGRFTEDARAFAEGRNVTLMDGDALFKMIRAARGAASARSDEPVRRAESKPASSSAMPDAGDTPLMPMCPRCAGPMVRRVAKKGANAGESFLGCSAFPKCRGTA
ncbi:Zn-finger domain associated with topoisomerase type I [Variovorax sp. SRS16]|uniref:restriction endonuclease n=1 Tax=Variovorax sp. SRS16 TaxID=282217 RepID=UPI001317B2D3|nr:restriction endonuclease [Variovorax sp. SRS16]VTU12855.1 Zn-finger domain associated with topoisomerase type I [Variovorax sp. SRS16]